MQFVNRLIIALAVICYLHPLDSKAATPPKLPPGTYSETYSCNTGAPVSLEIYILDQFEPVFKFDTTPYQKVRVEAGESVYVGHIVSGGAGPIQIYFKSFERQAPDYDSRISVIGIDTYNDGLRGSTRYEHDFCVLTPRVNTNAKPLASMNYAMQKLNPYANVPPPAGYEAATLPPARAAAYEKLARDAIIADSENWLVNQLDRNSIGTYQFYGDAASNNILLRAAYTYAGNVEGQNGWVEVYFDAGGVNCLHFFDSKACGRPRKSDAQKLAALGQGKPRLGPVAVPSASCFHRETRVSPRVPIYGPVTTAYGDKTSVVVGYSGGEESTVEIYQCKTSIHIEFECVNHGLAGFVGSIMVGGPYPPAGPGFSLSPGDEAPFSTAQSTVRAQLTELNAEIANKTCVRTR